MCSLLQITTTRWWSRPRDAKGDLTAVARTERTAAIATRCWTSKWWNARAAERNSQERRSASTSSGSRSKRRNTTTSEHWSVRSATRDSMERTTTCSSAWTTSATTCVTPTRTARSRAGHSSGKKSSLSPQSSHSLFLTSQQTITATLRLPACLLHQWMLSRWQVCYRLLLSKLRKISSQITPILLQWSKISQPMHLNRIISTKARFNSPLRLWILFQLATWTDLTQWWTKMNSRQSPSPKRQQTIPKIKLIRRTESTQKKKRQTNKLLISKTRSACLTRRSGIWPVISRARRKNPNYSTLCCRVILPERELKTTKRLKRCRHFKLKSELSKSWEPMRQTISELIWSRHFTSKPFWRKNSPNWRLNSETKRISLSASTWLLRPRSENLRNKLPRHTASSLQQREELRLNSISRPNKLTSRKWRSKTWVIRSSSRSWTIQSNWRSRDKQWASKSMSLGRSMLSRVHRPRLCSRKRWTRRSCFTEKSLFSRLNSTRRTSWLNNWVLNLRRRPSRTKTCRCASRLQRTNWPGCSRLASSTTTALSESPWLSLSCPSWSKTD